MQTQQATPQEPVHRPRTADQPLRILGSFWYWKDADLDALAASYPYEVHFFADSGAYSAWTQKSKVDIGEYADWLHRWRHRITTYANLDLKRDMVQSRKNQAYLERRGLTPIPVFHGGEPMEYLEELCSGYDYVAIGGSAGEKVQRDRKLQLWWAAKMFGIAQEHGTRFHGFGMLMWHLIRAFDWYSVDATTWTNGTRFGGLQLFDGRAGELRSVKLWNKMVIEKYTALFRSYGENPVHFYDRGQYNTTRNRALGVLSFRCMERYLQKRGRRLRIYFADSYPSQLPMLAQFEFRDQTQRRLWA